MNNRTIELGRTYYNGTAVLNVFLAAAAIFLMIYFVIISNAITASNYRIGLLNGKLAGLTEANGLLTAKKLSIQDSSVILDFAQGNHMVEAGIVAHIFENSDVAALR